MNLTANTTAAIEALLDAHHYVSAAAWRCACGLDLPATVTMKKHQAQLITAYLQTLNEVA